ncbi:S-adenosyl-L-methionine-dependent methyltransferase [Mycena belliarum]|uniref:type I protein arginine methyltransferase n=1 Tax=Mycena belliarum TaxID=1033014 RepID=A0AAD6UMH0_9AGAR|nr:S-adenosyl-L-methionine-dependent methyltransferase [Mycena belliae]
MSVHLLGRSTIPEDESSGEDSISSAGDDAEETWDDWVSDSMQQRPCRSLFEQKDLPSVEEALSYDRNTHGFDLDAFCGRLSLDTYGRIRLINFMRKTRPSPAVVNALTGTEEMFSSDEYLRPALEDDPLLQLQPDDWSDSDGEASDPTKRIKALENRLASAKQDLVDYRDMVSKQLDMPGLIAAVHEPAPAAGAPPARDDDSHYFQSYEANDIHAVMIQDKVRTSTYAQFILTNPSLFRDAVVLDVGCGTGILSLFAARSGAKRVFAVDASDIAEKAEKIVKANDLDHIITVIRGKVEDITLPDNVQQVDVIISEWMGYALLYESMLDSVLRARDRFLRPDGVMAPSQCKMMLALCDASEVVKDRVDFWDDVYGFDLSTMSHEIYDEAIVDVLGPDTLLSAPYPVKDLHLGVITPRQLDFVSSFKLVTTAERRTKVNSFILYFDTFFTVHGKPVPDGTAVAVIREKDAVLAEVWPVGGRAAPQRRVSSGVANQPEAAKITSFSTGPQSIPTHWKQTLFLLREPLIIEEGAVVTGHFHCGKSQTNSRELDVEIHYAVSNGGETGVTRVQMYKVR